MIFFIVLKKNELFLLKFFSVDNACIDVIKLHKTALYFLF